MTSDSVPAPMVPAALVDALDEWDVRYPAKWAFGASANYEMGVRDERRRLREIIVMGRNTFAVDAATPAASVPAADILALADEWEAEAQRALDAPKQNIGQEQHAQDLAENYRFFAAPLRALLDAADTPRSEPVCNHCGHPMNSHSENGCNGIGGTGDPCSCSPLVACPKCGHALDSPDGCSECPAPAAPTEPLCRCGHGREFHNPKITEPIFCQGSDACTCVIFTEAARVPVSDEAETWPVWYHANIERLWELEGRERDEALFKAGFRSARQEKA